MDEDHFNSGPLLESVERMRRFWKGKALVQPDGSHLQLLDGLSSFPDDQAGLACWDDHLLHGTWLAVARLVTPGHDLIYQGPGSPGKKKVEEPSAWAGSKMLIKPEKKSRFDQKHSGTLHPLLFSANSSDPRALNSTTENCCHYPQYTRSVFFCRFLSQCTLFP